jgi:hypothetical protein
MAGWLGLSEGILSGKVRRSMGSRLAITCLEFSRAGWKQNDSDNHGLKTNFSQNIEG